MAEASLEKHWLRETWDDLNCLDNPTSVQLGHAEHNYLDMTATWCNSPDKQCASQDMMHKLEVGGMNIHIYAPTKKYFPLKFGEGMLKQKVS